MCIVEILGILYFERRLKSSLKENMLKRTRIKNSLILQMFILILNPMVWICHSWMNKEIDEIICTLGLASVLFFQGTYWGYFGFVTNNVKGQDNLPPKVSQSRD